LKTIRKSAKLANVCYDIRGPIMDAARQMEEEGHKIIKLNIGNLAVFGFDAPEEIQKDMIRNLPTSAGYSDSKGIFAARKAVMHETQKQGVKGVTLDDIYLGNGASELIVMATNALLDNGDEMLLPAPDYPLWTAAVSLSGGTPVHYMCDEDNGWMPNLEDIRRKITPATKGIVAARKAVMHETQKQGVKGVTLDDIYLGNGASELIVMATNALLDNGDEMLLPAPDYPLWTAAVSLSGGTPVHYMCDEDNGWMPNLEDIRRKITPATKGIVVINPNNPTGALYSDELLLQIVQLAREHNLVIFADEVYDKVLYDGVKHTALASLSEDVLTLTFNSLSKSYRSCGYRAGWLVVSGD